MSDTFNEFLNRLEKPDKLCPWSIYMFAMEIAQRRGLGGEYIRKHIRVVDNNTLQTDLYAPDDYCIASISLLYCGTPQPDGLRSPVPWNDVTNDMVNKFLDELAKEFADYIHQTYVCGLSDSEPREGTTLEDRALKLKGIVEKVMPDKIPSYLNLSEDMSCDLLGRFDKEDVTICLIQSMKHDLIDYISSI